MIRELRNTPPINKDEGDKQRIENPPPNKKATIKSVEIGRAEAVVDVIGR